MTPLFCVDITENRNNDRINGCDTELLEQKTSDLLSSSHDRLLERAETVNGHARLPAFLRLIWYLCGILALLIVLAVVKNLLGRAHMRSGVAGADPAGQAPGKNGSGQRGGHKNRLQAGKQPEGHF